MEKKPREMTGAELQSMLKSSINFKSLGGMKCEELNLPPGDKEWWQDAKIGMFIHWGLYSILGRGEWARFNEQIPKEEYEALADEFIPEDFQMKEWADLALDFGAKYAVMVSRHHDGFALWNSEGSYEHFSSWHRGAKRDFIKEYIEACHGAGLRTGLYYSPMDWRFPGYFDPEGRPENAALMKQQCYDQVRELCSNYGNIDILWYDGGWLAHKGSDTSSAWFWEPVKLNKMARSLCPKLLINPRSGWEGDFYCDEGSHEINGKIIPVLWEKNMCVCSGSSWGWMPDDPVADFDWLIRMMVNVVCRGGNWLVNIGPDRNGKVSPEIIHRMREVGAWLGKYGESIYSTRSGPYEPVDNVYGSTFKGNRVYLHILDTEAFRRQILPDIQNPVIKAELFDGGDISIEAAEGGYRLILPEPQALLESQITLEPQALLEPQITLEPQALSPDKIVILTMKEAVQEKESERVYFTGKE